MTDDEEVLVQERFWNGAWKQVLLRLTLILGIMLMGVGGYSAVWRIQHPRTDTPPQRCRDYATSSCPAARRGVTRGRVSTRPVFRNRAHRCPCSLLMQRPPDAPSRVDRPGHVATSSGNRHGAVGGIVDGRRCVMTPIIPRTDATLKRRAWHQPGAVRLVYGLGRRLRQSRTSSTDGRAMRWTSAMPPTARGLLRGASQGCTLSADQSRLRRGLTTEGD